MRVRWLVEKYKNNTNVGSTDRDIYQRCNSSSRYASMRSRIDTLLFHLNSKNKIKNIRMCGSNVTKGDSTVEGLDISNSLLVTYYTIPQQQQQPQQLEGSRWRTRITRIDNNMRRCRNHATIVRMITIIIHPLVLLITIHLLVQGGLDVIVIKIKIVLLHQPQRHQNTETQ